MNNNKWMVYDRIIKGNVFVKIEPFNLNKIELLEKQGMGEIVNLYSYTRKADAMTEWKRRTNGTIYETKKSNNNKKSIPQALRKAGNIHKRMEWEWENNYV